MGRSIRIEYWVKFWEYVVSSSLSVVDLFTVSAESTAYRSPTKLSNLFLLNCDNQLANCN